MQEDWDSLVSLAKSQVKQGAHVLDVNVDYVGRDGVRDMHELVSRCGHERYLTVDVGFHRVGKDGVGAESFWGQVYP